jgi:SAM-dependent methyltransferase
MAGGTKRLGNYREQAKSYDFTRGASPTVVDALGDRIGEAGERSLLDAAGGTGNYAVAMAALGFRVVVLDAQIDMLRRAVLKLGSRRTVVGDVQSMPFPDRSFDVVMMVNAIHLVTDRVAALREARRVMRDGPLVLTAFTRENLASLFVFEYFGLADEIEERASDAEVEAMLHDAGFMKVVHRPYAYADVEDGSLNALHIDARALADPKRLRNTSFWHRLDEDTRRRGVEALRRDLESGALERRVAAGRKSAESDGHGTLFAAWP